MNADDLRRLSKEATRGPWEEGERYVTAGVGFENGPGKCALCSRSSAPVLIGRFDINGKAMEAHVHAGTDYSNGHCITAFDGRTEPVMVAGTYDYEAGIVDPADTALIVYLRNHADAIADLIEAAAGIPEHVHARICATAWLGEGRECDCVMSNLRAALSALEEK